ncbi:MAG: Lrp/AsnC family transcriptional regulator [Stackebrandtia sp.]
MPSTPNLDEIDTHLLDLLQHDAGRTLRELGTEVGLTPSAVQRRIARYRKSGLISRQVAVLDPHRLGATILAAVMVTLRRESVEHHRAFAERMRDTPQVQQCYSISGPWDYLVVLAAGSARDCSRLGDRLFKTDDNVQRYETSIVFDTVKAGLTIPVAGSR